MPFPKGRPPTAVEFDELLSHMTPELWEIVRSRTPAGHLDQLNAAFEESRAIVETYERKPMQTVKRNWGGGHIVRTVYTASKDDARQTHQENYADEPIVAVHQ